MGVCDVPVISTVCDTVGEGAATLVSAPFDWLAQAMGAAAGWLFEAVWSVFDTTTLVDVTSQGYVKVYNLLFGIAVFVMLIFFCLQLITGLIKRDPTALTRAGLGLAKSVLGSFVVITITGLGLQIVDQLSTGIIQAAGETTESMGAKITLLAAGLTGINIAAPGVGAIITIFLAGLAISAAAIVWLSLLIRKALLLVAIVFAPLAFSGASWDASRGWISKWAMFVVALIASKLVLVVMFLVVMFLVAITQVAAPIDGDLASIGDPIAGVVLMAMAAFAPYLTYKFIAFVGFDMYHAIGAEQDAKQALNRPIPTPSSLPQGVQPQKILGGSTASTSTEAGGGSGGSTPPPTPTPKPTAAATPGEGSTSTAPETTTGTGASSTTGASSAGAAGAGPTAAVVVGAEIAKDSFTAGPKVGQALGGQGEVAADAANHNPTPTQDGTLAPPSTPVPTAPAHSSSPPQASTPASQSPAPVKE